MPPDLIFGLIPGLNPAESDRECACPISHHTRHKARQYIRNPKFCIFFLWKNDADVLFLCCLTLLIIGEWVYATVIGEWVPIVNYIAMSPGGSHHFLGADDMGRAEKDCASMAKYLHEKCVSTGHERSPYLCVLDGALSSLELSVVKKAGAA
jgi:hypothetical protein